MGPIDLLLFVLGEMLSLLLFLLYLGTCSLSFLHCLTTASPFFIMVLSCADSVPRHLRFAPLRPASEYSSPGRPLSCIVDENTPISTNGATPTTALPPSDGDHRAQERRVRSQRHRNYMSRTHLHTPPDLPEGYG